MDRLKAAWWWVRAGLAFLPVVAAVVVIWVVAVVAAPIHGAVVDEQGRWPWEH